MENKIKVEKYIPDANIIALRLTMLLTSLQSSLYCIAEMEPHKLSGSLKMRYINLRTAIKSFITMTYNKADKKELAEMDDKLFDKVAHFAELLPVITQIPEDKIEQYIKDCKILASRTLIKK